MTEAAAGFDRLHPAIQHHIVNSLGWRSLRPLQEATIGPILDGEHVLAMAPTAGGKTEAAILPVLSRMLTEDWRGFTVVYVCPLRALLNNLHVRLQGYADLVGRRVGLWHGDIKGASRTRMLREPPDILLTTPESLEAMMVSTKVFHHDWFSQIRCVVVDEAHAFVGDDRGWHLLALLARLSRLCGREIQRIGLSATIGNPEEVLEWLTTGCSSPRQVINPPVAASAPPEVVLDYVGSLGNAAVVISRLHRGEKRLVFVDSRARAEELAAGLRLHGVTTFVSHGSLGVDERRQAETAFAEARDCVIVATSTLELGIDVGDLDRVIQIDAPPTVASFLQRLGRTGRRAGTTRNCTLLATSPDSLLVATSVLLRWSEGFVEPTVPPPLPLHLVAQQVLALALQEGAVGRHTWRQWLGSPFVFGPACDVEADRIVDHLVEQGYLFDDGSGMLSIGGTAESEFGRRHFMELLAVFSAPPLFSIRHGRTEIGLVPDETLMLRPRGGPDAPRVLLLGGRSWKVTHIDWPRRVAWVEPIDQPGLAKWSGSSMPLGSELATGVRSVLCGKTPTGVHISKRAADRLARLRTDMSWAKEGTTTLVTENGRTTWWTFAGRRANYALAAAITDLRRTVTQTTDLTIPVDPGTPVQLIPGALRTHDFSLLEQEDLVDEDGLHELKFSACLPKDLSVRVVGLRLRDPTGLAKAAGDGLTHYPALPG